MSEMRITITMPQHKRDEIESIMELCDIKTHGDFINVAYALIIRTAYHIRAGKQLLLFDPHTKVGTLLDVEPLQRIAHIHSGRNGSGT